MEVKVVKDGAANRFIVIEEVTAMDTLEMEERRVLGTKKGRVASAGHELGDIV